MAVGATIVEAPAAPLRRAALDEVLYEVIDGQVVETLPMGIRQEIVAGILYGRLLQVVDGHSLGRAVMETLFDFEERLGRKRRPDVAFVSETRWPRNKTIPDSEAWAVVPNLAVEVVSRTNSWETVMEKIDEFFQVGVERVWVVSPPRRQVHVYETATSVRILTHADNLTDDQLLPGFRLPLRELFEGVCD